MSIKKLSLTHASRDEQARLHRLMPHLFNAPAPYYEHQGTGVTSRLHMREVDESTIPIQLYIGDAEGGARRDFIYVGESHLRAMAEDLISVADMLANKR